MARDDPYPRYRLLRTRDPVHFNPMLRGWILTRYADIVAVLQDARFSAERKQAILFEQLGILARFPPDFAEVIERSLLARDPPDHTRLRRLVNNAFTQRRVEALRPRIQRIVDELLEEWRDGRDIELIGDLAGPLPVIVIAEMLGVPAADRMQLKHWCSVLAPLIDPLHAENDLGMAGDAFVEFSTYFREICKLRRCQPQDDLVSALVAAEECGDKLSEAELLSLCMLIVGAGSETTTNLIGNAVLALLRYPDQRRRLLEDPSLMPSAVEEFLRFDSPVQATHRMAVQDCEIAGHQIRTGQLVMLLLGAANRDPQRFPNPDRLDLGRRNNDHLAFSYGAHFCLGASLARAQTQIALATLLRRFPNFDGAPQPPGWKHSMVLRGPTALPLRLG